MVVWYQAAQEARDDPASALAFTKAFLSAAPAERVAVRDAWDPKLTWRLPDPWRLACTSEGLGCIEDRLETTLLFGALALSVLDDRDTLVGLAVVFNSAKLAGIEPTQLFEKVAQAVGGRAETAIRDFARRDPADQSMEAFMLKAVVDPSGGVEIRADW